ncbi:molybdopterin molybdenumtransferase MoeA [Aureimonas sp. SA4125]|uniref:molybdopterin molybdotransferase MoeA n=1 Tax=Aureimonas sp. SA4125 TaxID=2826993 RepID=UPI001CC72283|nr:gephyrin-like molybdotransferase Glp [Aureimonas sp. SA4125]BDA85718.1 molybdopterin molybdenumtransferase MoeA [Aureimonas sp. SA4125]
MSDLRQVGDCFTARGLLTPAAAAALVTEGLAAIQGTEVVTLDAAAGRILAEAVVAPRSLPPFDHSAVDGYALALRPSAEQADRFKVVGRVPAGRPMQSEVAPGNAVRIFTGAALPAGCDTVVMQEHAEVADGFVVPRRSYRAGDNIRLAGEDVAAGVTILPEGLLLDARHLALLAASGLSSVVVRRRLRIAVISTGTELRAPGEDLCEGAIYDSNRIMLLALLRHPAVDLVDGGIIADEGAAIVAAIDRAARSADLVVTSGGVSVGEEDLVRSSVEAAGGSLLALRIGMKPGKPLAFGRLGRAAILGLPGNPLAAMIGFLVVAKPLVSRLVGLSPTGLRIRSAVAGFDRDVTPGRMEFAPASIIRNPSPDRPVVDTLGRGGSARLLPLSMADGFCVIPADVQTVRQGDAVGFVPIGDLDLFR